MSMDLSQYQKVKADEKFSVLRHKNGSEFKIAHEGLSPEIASRIHKMPMFAGGGMPSLGTLATDALNPTAALASATTGVPNPLAAVGNGIANGGVTAKSAGIGQQAPAAAYAPGVQTPYTAAGVQQAQNTAQGATGQQGVVAGQTTSVNGSQNLNNALVSSNNIGGSIANIGGQKAQTAAIGQQGAQNAATGAAGQQGVANQQAGVTGLQSTANQLQNVANGTGPNPAQAMLNQQTGANVANQAALMAGQRGASANAGLIARQAAQQGAATQQQAVGQGATMQAQQSLGALGQLTGANSAIVNAGAGQVGQAQTGISSLASQGQVATGQQQAQNAQGAGIAQNQVGNAIGATTAGAQGAQNEQQIQTGGLGAQNTVLGGEQQNINTVGGTLNNTGLQGTQGMVGGLTNVAGPALGTVLQSAGAARGGEIAYEGGGQITPGVAQVPGGATPQISPETAQVPVAAPVAGPQSSFGQFLSNWGNKPDKPDKSEESAAPSQNPGAAALKQGITAGGQGFLKNLMAAAPVAAAAASRGGKVKALVSEGEVVIPPKDAANPAKAARDVAQAKASGGTIKASSPGQKATKPGNSYANDKIEKDLPVGGIVIPRSVMQSKDPIRGAAEFVKAVMAKKGAK